MESNGNNSAVRRSTSQAELDKALQEEEMEEYLLNELMKVKVDDDQISLDGLIDDLKSKYQDTNTQVEELQTLLDQGDAEKTDQSLDVLSVQNATHMHEITSDGSVKETADVHVTSVENTSNEKASDVVHTGGLPTINQLEDTVPTATGEQTNSDPPSTTDKDENNVSSDPDIRSDGSLLTSGDKSCLGENSEGVQTCRAEANSAQALNTGVPPGCEVPHSECVDVLRVIPPEHDSTDDGHLPLTSINQSGGDCGQEVNHVEGRDEEYITGGFPNNKVEADPIVVTGSSETSKDPQKNGEAKTKDKDTDKVKKQEKKREKKEQVKKTGKDKHQKTDKVKKGERRGEKKEKGKKPGKVEVQKTDKVKKQEKKREKKEQGKKTGEAKDDQVKKEEGKRKKKEKKTVKDNKTEKVEVMDKEKEADTKGKRSKDEKKKSKKSRRGLLGLLCCCFKGQEIDDRDEIQETEKTRSTARGHSKDASKSSFATIDLDN